MFDKKLSVWCVKAVVGSTIGNNKNKTQRNSVSSSSTRAQYYSFQLRNAKNKKNMPNAQRIPSTITTNGYWQQQQQQNMKYDKSLDTFYQKWHTLCLAVPLRYFVPHLSSTSKKNDDCPQMKVLNKQREHTSAGVHVNIHHKNYFMNGSKKISIFMEYFINI